MTAPTQNNLYKGKVSHYIPSRFGVSWRKRYLVLTADALHIYKSETHTGDVPETIDLHQLQYAYPKHLRKSSSYVFQLEFQDPTRTNLEFRCHSEEELSCWISLIQEQLSALKAAHCDKSPAVGRPYGPIQSPTVLDKWLDRLHLSSSAHIYSTHCTPTLMPKPKTFDALSLRSGSPEPTYFKNTFSPNSRPVRSSSLRSVTPSTTHSLDGQESTCSSSTSFSLTPPPPLRRCATQIRKADDARPARKRSHRRRMQGFISPTFGHVI